MAFSTGTFFEIIDGLPEGAEFRGTFVDGRKSTLIALFSHKDWPIVAPHMEVPKYVIRMKTYSSAAIQVFKRFIDTMALE